MRPAKSTGFMHKLSSTWLEATTADHHLHPSDRKRGPRQRVPSPIDLPNPFPLLAPTENLPRVFTVTTSLKELVPSLF